MTRFLLALVALGACPGPSEKPAGDTGDTAETGTEGSCPSTIEELCEQEFGGACPSFDDAAAYYCDGPHFAESGAESPNVNPDGDETCPNPRVSCFVTVDGVDLYTRLYFDADMSGRLEGVLLTWPDTDECPGHRQFGDLWC